MSLLIVIKDGLIITEGGLTPAFDFLGFLFLISVEILLMKLKLSPSLEKVVILNTIGGDDETLEGVSFADDLITLVAVTRASLVKSKRILSDFLELDLEVNLEKSAVRRRPGAAGRQSRISERNY